MSDNNTGWLYAHGATGILSQADVDALKAGAQRVYGLMRGGDWHTPEQIDLAAGKGGIPAAASFSLVRFCLAITVSSSVPRAAQASEKGSGPFSIPIRSPSPSFAGSTCGRTGHVHSYCTRSGRCGTGRRLPR